MDIARMRTYVVVTVVLFAFAVVRVLLNVNPIYSLLEPVTERLSAISSGFSLTDQTAVISDTNSSELERLQAENDALRKVGSLDDSRTTISAEVIRRNLLGFEKNVWVGQGSSSGVTVGQTVLFDGQLFGIVERVFDRSSEIKLINDPSFRSTIEVGGEQGVIKIDHGSIIVDLVPSKSLEGSLVRTNGIDGLLSAGVPVGVLGELSSDESTVFASYPVELSYSLYTAEFLQIVVDGNEGAE